MMKEKLLEKFQDVYGDTNGTKVYFAPGRVNLIGEHIDYSGGLVLPCALTLGTYGVARKRGDKKIKVYSMNMEDEIQEIAIGDYQVVNESDWTNYIKGVLWAFEKKEMVLPFGMDLLLFGDLPSGAGLSSSASLEVLIGFIMRDLYGFDVTNVDLALIGQQAEHEFCGVNCGIMDQFASVFGKEGKLMRLDCRSREFEYFPFNPEGYKLVLLDSKVKHELKGSPYNDRRNSCENVVKHIAAKHPESHFETLRDCSWEQLEEVKDEVGMEDYTRAHFVLGEKDRVLAVCDALQKGDYETVGQKMYETHDGLSKEYEVSCEELDYLNELAKENGVTGSRIMGGGFGGCTINLVKDSIYDSFIANAKQKFAEKYGHEPAVYNVVINDGAHKVC